MKSPEAVSYADSETGPEEGKMVDVTRISAIFSEEKELLEIGGDLAEKGLISGFHVNPIFSGYFHRGKKVEESQYALEILLADDVDEAVKREIRGIIEKRIGKKWDVPAIEEEHIRINEKLLGFVEQGPIEHKKYLREKKLKLTVALSALLAISSSLGALSVKKHYEEKEQNAVATERARSYKKISDLEKKVSEQIFALDAQIAAGKPLKETPSDMSAEIDYKETAEILNTVREVESETRKIAEAENTK